MQCFGYVWVDVLLGVIALCHVLPLLIKNHLLERVLLALHLLCHGGLAVVMLLHQLPLEELLALVLASALLGLGTVYLKERGSEK